MKVSFIGLLVVLSALFAACSSTGAPQPQAAEEVPGEVADSEGWIAVAPGFRYRNTYGGIDFWVTPPELTASGLQKVESHINALERNASSEMDRFRLAEWKKTLASASEQFEIWKTYWPKLQEEYRKALEELSSQKINESTLQPAATSCSLGATAAPTTSKPGAKAYATANCTPDGRAISGYVRTETTAHAGSSWPPACSNDAWATTQCSSTAYGTYSCSSSAYSAYYYKYSDLTIVQDSRSSSNSKCS